MVGEPAADMKPLERIARAICAERSPRLDKAEAPASVRPHVAQAFFAHAQQVWIDQNWRDYVPDARAALLSIREPTAEMKAAAPRWAIEAGYEGWNDDEWVAEKTWRTMIDKASED